MVITVRLLFSDLGYHWSKRRTHNIVKRKREERRLNIKDAGSISLRSEILKDRKGIASFVTFFIIVSIITSLIYIGSGPYYEVEFDRRYSTRAEYEILKETEGLDYGSYWNKSLFYDRPSDPDYIPGFSEKVLPNFINTTSLNFYSDKFEYLEDNKLEREALLHYYAKVYPLGNYDVECKNIDSSTIWIYSDDKIIFNEYLDLNYLFAEDQTYQAINTHNRYEHVTRNRYDPDPVTIDNTFNKTYIVHMEINLWEYYVETREGYVTDFCQVVIMDEEFNVKMVIVDKPWQGIV